MPSTRTVLLSTGATALLGFGLVAGPAGAANRTSQEGLVNLALTDTTVQLPISLAANVCGVAVNVLASQLGQGPVDCDAASGATAVSRDSGSNNTRQSGLVNVAVTDTTVQAPIGIAANVCGVAVNVLANATATSPVDCTATGVSMASA